MKNYFWPIYKSLEDEFISTFQYVLCDDLQAEVYSEKYLDILLRTAVEVEALSKILYDIAGGPIIQKDSEKYFDNICLKYLNKTWLLDKKVLIVSNTEILFEKSENKYLKPLKKADEIGDRAIRWKRAYQAVKHNRIDNYKKANMINCLNALGALFILNLYYKDSEYKLMNDAEVNAFDLSQGSRLFSINISKVNSFDGKLEPDVTAIYCINYSKDFTERWSKKLEELNAALNEGIITNQLFIDALNTGEIQISDVGDVGKIRDVFGDKFNDILGFALKKVNINDFIATREYRAYLNK
ncbi:hypothetical protein [Pseudobutyrivibrio sp. 49]|uniref:hypothetical protein n=1 Tax=Pseudobutyrivibrio sp. 49 TaxID=1855344 RepID=UPI000B7FF9E7|nr:hypothetical protein [Pseudobutyrivibrio sp. 49]